MDKLNLIDFDKYTITRDGKIFSHSVLHRCKEMHGYLTKRGYIRANMLCKDKQQRSYQWHRVIWYYFNGEIPEGLEVNHKDEDKTNNSLDNLELLTHTENINYGTRNQRAGASNSIALKGHHLSDECKKKLSLANSKPVLQYNLETNEPIKEWHGVREAARCLNLKNSSIAACCRGGLYQKGKWVNLNQAYGYGWKYI